LSTATTPPPLLPTTGSTEPVNIPTAPTLAPRIGFESFELSKLAPPASLYVTADDFLLVKVHASVAGLTVVVRSRFLDPEGEVIPQSFPLVPTSNRVVTTKAFPLQEGFLLGGSVQLDAGTARRGQAFVQVLLVRGGTLATDPAQTLVSDYVVAGQLVGWPQGRVQQSVEGPGALRSITGTVPGAGNQVLETVPTGARWLLRTFRVQLVTSAVVANRRVHFVLDDGANILQDIASADVQAASLTRNYNMDPAGIIRTVQDNEIYLAINSDYRLSAGFRLRTTTTAGDVGDAFGAPQYEVEEWIEP
jgi:hypothetical protein